MIGPHILRRLVIARTFLIRTQDSMKRSYDESSLAMAAVTLHDAVDNLLGAVASYKSVELKPESSMLATYRAISSKINLSHSNDIAQLNRHRNNVKHWGQVPNSADISVLLSEIVNFCDQTCMSVFNLPLARVSMKEQIQDQAAKANVEKVENAIDKADYKQAMLDASTLMFTHFTDKHLATWRLTSALTDLTGAMKGKSRVSAYNMAFPTGVARDLNLDLMQIGIDPYLYYRFTNLTPHIGYIDHKTKTLIYKNDGSTWHDGNWTEENALFCLNFLIDALVKQQRRYEGYTIQTRRSKHKVQFIKDSTVLDYLYKPFVYHKKGDLFEGGLLSYADNSIQVSRHTEKGYTDIIIDSNGKAEIVLLKVGDFKVIEEAAEVTREWF